MIFLDTNVVIFLYSGYDNFSKTVIKLIDDNDCFISPMVKLELQYLHEIGRAKPNSQTVLEVLHKEIGLDIDHLPFNTIVDAAINASWTRDPFDRLITAHARALDSYLVTSDNVIHKHYKKAVWK